MRPVLLCGAMALLLLLQLSFSFAEDKEPWIGKLADGTVLTEEGLKAILAEHAKWVDSFGKEGKRADLAGANLFRANLSGANLSQAELSGAILAQAKLLKADLDRATLVEAMLSGADLSGSDLSQADLTRAELSANLNWADLTEANLSEANLNGASLYKAILVGSNLSKSTAFTSKFWESNFKVSIVDGLKLSDADFAGAYYESVIGVPDKNYLSGLVNIETITYGSQDSVSALVVLRNIFREIGLRESERKATYAIQYGQLKFRPWPERIFHYILFVIPCDYGLYPGRCLRILALLIPIFALAYIFPIRGNDSDSGIYQIWHTERIPKYIGTDQPQRLQGKGWASVGWALYFSLIVACRIGWRDLNLGTWISHLQRREYILKPTGWVRSVAGVQSVLSVYLLALWVLTYFGRPFE